MLHRVAHIIFVLAFLFGCAPITEESTVWKEPEISFDRYETIEIHQVINATGKTFTVDIASLLTVYLKEQIVEKPLLLKSLSQKNRGRLTVRSEIHIYEPYTEGTTWPSPVKKAQCVVRTRLVDETKNQLRVVAQIDTVIMAGRPGYYSALDQRLFLKETAIKIAKEVDKITRSKELE